MKKTPVTPDDLSCSVLSVPPLARNADLSYSAANNRAIVDHLHAGGVTTYIYGGNANFYNVGVREFEKLLLELEEIAPADGWMVPSIGPDFGKAVDQAAAFRSSDFPTAMVLPLSNPATSDGVATGLRKLADICGRPLIAYVKFDGYVTPADLGRLDTDGVLAAIKYATVRKNPEEDDYLAELVQCVSPSKIISGIGERPVLAHLGKFGLQGFTSGSVCIAPHLSTAILKALKADDFAEASRLRDFFLPLEDLRDAHSPLQVLHEAVRLAGVADTGPMYPFLANIADPALLERIREQSRRLRGIDHSSARAPEPV